jgi:hypothetical protein
VKHRRQRKNLIRHGLYCFFSYANRFGETSIFCRQPLQLLGRTLTPSRASIVSRSSLLDREPSEIKLRRTPSEVRREEIRLQRTPSEIRRDSEARLTLRRTPSEIRRDPSEVVKLRRTPSESRREITATESRRRSSGRENGRSSDVLVLTSPGAVSAVSSSDRSSQARTSAARRPYEEEQPVSLDYAAAAFTCEDSPSLRYMDSLTTTYNGEGETTSTSPGLSYIERQQQSAAGTSSRPSVGAVKRKESLQSYTSELDRSSDSNKGMFGEQCYNGESARLFHLIPSRTGLVAMGLLKKCQVVVVLFFKVHMTFYSSLYFFLPQVP